VILNPVASSVNCKQSDSKQTGLGVPWFRVDDDYPTHPGTLAVSLAARGLWATAGAWCSKRLTDVAPNHVLASFGSTPELETELRLSGAWKKVRGGWRFTQEGLCKIPSKEAVEHERKTAAERQRKRRARHASVTQVSRPLSRSPEPVDNSEQVKKPRSKEVVSRRDSRRDNGVTPGSITSTTKEPPNPPPSGGHDGSHPNCRACGTNPRGPAPPPVPTPTPPPVADVLGTNGRAIRGRDVAAIAAEARKAMTRKDPP